MYGPKPKPRMYFIKNNILVKIHFIELNVHW